MKSHEKEL